MYIQHAYYKHLHDVLCMRKGLQLLLQLKKKGNASLTLIKQKMVFTFVIIMNMVIIVNIYADEHMYVLCEHVLS